MLDHNKSNFKNKIVIKIHLLNNINNNLAVYPKIKIRGRIYIYKQIYHLNNQDIYMKIFPNHSNSNNKLIILMIIVQII